jgi:XRE family transcriptional regulator, regulator of sulfur utilization
LADKTYGVAKDIKRALGRKIREMRRAHGWSQEQMGEASDLHWTYVGQVERGERNLTLGSIHAIAKAFKIKISELTQGID